MENIWNLFNDPQSHGYPGWEPGHGVGGRGTAAAVEDHHNPEDQAREDAYASIDCSSALLRLHVKFAKEVQAVARALAGGRDPTAEEIASAEEIVSAVFRERECTPEVWKLWSDCGGLSDDDEPVSGWNATGNLCGW